MKKIRNIVLILALLTISSAASFKLGEYSVSRGSSEEKLDLSLMWKVKGRLESLFLEKENMDEKGMTYGAIQGMVAALNDPYTVFLPPKENKSSNEDLAGEFGGVGISLGYKDKTLAVMSPLPKTPAEAAGVKAGDLILRIKDSNKGLDRDTVGISLDEAVENIRGKVGSEVTLTLFREGGEGSFEVILKRDNIVVPSVELEWKENDGKNIAWVKMYKFTERLYEEWDEIVDEINNSRGSDFGGIVLDLRNNPGGYLNASVEVASDFLEKGVVVKQEAYDGSVETYSVDTKRKGLLWEELVVLINGGSASASEILAGALREHDRARLVGETTFGKGTVQQPENFSDGSGLHVTVAKWLLPSGKNIHDEGVSPDVEISDDAETEEDEQLMRAMDLLLE
ncbi:MAG: S41 family peptidase [Patescibacteria group bacterium]